MHHRSGRALPVVATAAAVYALFTLAALALHGWDPLWFVWIGERFANLEPTGRTGYDGQFVYYIARDGWAAIPHLDNAAYRFGRIGYPLLARLLSGGNPAALPWALVAINALAILTTTLLVTRWLIAHGLSAWYGLVYAFYVGNLMSYSRDLTEPLAYALAFAGALCWFGERRAVAVVLLAAAALTREITMIFVGGLAVAELAQRRWQRLAGLAGALVPLLVWHLHVRDVLGIAPVQQAGRLLVIPGTAAFSFLSLEPGRLSALIFFGLPVLALSPWAVRLVWRAPRDPIAWLVALHWLFALQLPYRSHLHVLLTGRLLTGLLLALLLAFPRCPPGVRVAIAVCGVGSTVIWLPVVLWWAPWTAKV